MQEMFRNERACLTKYCDRPQIYTVNNKKLRKLDLWEDIYIYVLSCHERNPKVCGLTRPHMEIRIFFFIARHGEKKHLPLFPYRAQNSPFLIRLYTDLVTLNTTTFNEEKSLKILFLNRSLLLKSNHYPQWLSLQMVLHATYLNHFEFMQGLLCLIIGATI